MGDSEFMLDKLQIVINNDFIEKHVPNLSKLETNLLMGFMGKLKRENDEIVTVSFSEAAAMTNGEKKNPAEVKRIANSMWNKVKGVDYRVYVKTEDLDVDLYVMLFSTMAIDNNNEEISFSINPHLKYFTNDFEKNGNFTSLKYSSILAIDDSVAKKLHILLSQYNNTGVYLVKTDELKIYLDCPKSYTTSRFIKELVNPALEKLQPYFQGLKMTVKKKGQGGRIVSHRFTFKPQKVSPEWDEGFSRKNKKSSVKEVNPTYAKQEDGDMSMEEYAHEVNKLFVK